MNILLIAGGWSSEREVALSGGRQILVALEKLGHNATFYDPAENLDELPFVAAGKDFAFINLHGSPGEDGLIQAMLDQLGIPYQGSGPAGSMLALDKAAAKGFFRAAGLRTADWKLLARKPAGIPDLGFSYPLFIKDNTGGSTLGMERVPDAAALPDALDRLFTAHTGAHLVEPEIKGIEITCGVLGELVDGREVPVALPPILIKPKATASGFFDYASKYSPGGAEELCPAPIPDDMTKTIQNMAVVAHTCLGLSGYSRADFLLPEDGKPVILETNTLPGMTPTSLIPKEAAAIGLSFEALIQRLIDLGMARKRAQ